MCVCVPECKCVYLVATIKTIRKHPQALPVVEFRLWKSKKLALISYTSPLVPGKAPLRPVHGHWVPEGPKQEMDHTIMLSLKGYYVLPSNQTTCHCTCICVSEAALDVSQDMASFKTVCENNNNKKYRSSKDELISLLSLYCTCSDKLLWFQTVVLFCVIFY